MVNTIISWIVFGGIILYMLTVFGVFLFKAKGWEEKVKFIRTFKFGKWSALFIICIPLFVIGNMSNGNPVDDSIFRAFTSTFKLITLSFDFTFKLTETDIAFKCALYCCYVAVVINDILIATSCFFQSAINYIRARKFSRCKKEKCMIIGNNAKSLMIYNSCEYKKIIVGSLTEIERRDLFSKKVVYHNSKDEARLLKYVERQIRKYGKKLLKASKNKNQALPRFRIIVNTCNDELNIKLIDKISQMFKNINDEAHEFDSNQIKNIKEEIDKYFESNKTDKVYKDLKTMWESFVSLYKEANKLTLYETKKVLIKKFWNVNQKSIACAMDNTDVYVYGSRKNQDNYRKFESISCGCVHYVNANKMIADDFVTRYPLSKFLSEQHIDYKTGIVKPETDLRVIMIGFGKTNQQIFLSLLNTCQFIWKGKGSNKLEVYPTKYSIFDKILTLENKDLSTYAFRYKYEVVDHLDKFKNDQYFELPNFPIMEQLDDCFKTLDINSASFYETLKTSLSHSTNGINYVIVSLGDDYETTDVSSKIIERIKQWELTNTTHLFAGIDSAKVSKNKSLINFTNFNNFYTFGDEEDIVYNYNTLVNDFYTNLAIKQNTIYNTEDSSKFEISQLASMRDRHLTSWNTTSLYDRASSLQSVLSIPHKLYMMGKELVFENNPRYKDESNIELTTIFKKYSKYYKDEKAKFDICHIESEMWINQNETEFKPGIRFNLAWLEHERWNHYMMTIGYIPLSKDGMIKAKRQKNDDIRAHGCLTTFEGLESLQGFLEDNGIKKPGCGEYRHYDYQILDSLPLLLYKEKCAIVNKESIQK